MLFTPKYAQFDAKRHFRPRLKTAIYLQEYGAGLERLLFDPLIELISDKLENEVQLLTRFSPGQKALYCWTELQRLVNNGGFDSYYNSDGFRNKEATKAGLELINALNMRDLYCKVAEKCKREKLTLDNFDYDYSFWNEFEDLFYKFESETSEKLESYIRLHINDFCSDENGNNMRAIPDNISLIQCFHPNGIIEAETQLRNGKPHGICYIQDCDGLLLYRREFDKGILCWEEYYSQPGRLFRKTIINPVTNSTLVENYSEYAQIISSTQYDSTGSSHKHYYPNGSQYIEYHINTEGQFDSDIIHYYPNGQLASISISENGYEGGKRIPISAWSDDGIQTLKNGTGVWNHLIYLDQYEIAEYVEGKRHGQTLVFQSDKQIKSERWDKGILIETLD